VTSTDLRPEVVLDCTGPGSGPTGRDAGLFAPAPSDDAVDGSIPAFFASFDFLGFFGGAGPNPADTTGFVGPRGAAGPADTVGFGDPGGLAGPAGPVGPAAESRA